MPTENQSLLRTILHSKLLHHLPHHAGRVRPRPLLQRNLPILLLRLHHLRRYHPPQRPHRHRLRLLRPRPHRLRKTLRTRPHHVRRRAHRLRTHAAPRPPTHRRHGGGGGGGQTSPPSAAGKGLPSLLALPHVLSLSAVLQRGIRGRGRVGDPRNLPDSRAHAVPAGEILGGTPRGRTASLERTLPLYGAADGERRGRVRAEDQEGDAEVREPDDARGQHLGTTDERHDSTGSGKNEETVNGFCLYLETSRCQRRSLT
mmetsp:Transcript_32227/g.74205  ORF Transcript_32227/g.74205 Transcript_32227/m.74205 type:complete len:258 (+) Transcript_32227:2573-3346(+)